MVVNETGCGFLAGSVLAIDQYGLFSAAEFLQQLSDMPNSHGFSLQSKVVVTSGFCPGRSCLQFRHSPQVTENCIEPLGLKRQCVVVLAVTVYKSTDFRALNLVRFQCGDPVLDRDSVQPVGKTSQLIPFQRGEVEDAHSGSTLGHPACVGFV